MPRIATGASSTKNASYAMRSPRLIPRRRADPLVGRQANRLPIRPALFDRHTRQDLPRAPDKGNEISHFDPKKRDEKRKSKEFIDGCMSHLEVDMSEHAKWQLRTAMANVAELAEGCSGAAGIALCKAVCGGQNGCTDLGCKMLPSYQNITIMNNPKTCRIAAGFG